MLKTIKRLFVTIVAFTLLFIPAYAGVTYAASISDCVSNGVSLDNLDPGTGCTKDPAQQKVGTNVTSVVTLVVNILSILVGVIAVIMIIWGGMKYITSGGDSNKVKGAKDTIIYALIGLVIVALAQFIVRFVLNKASSLNTPTP